MLLIYGFLWNFPILLQTYTRYIDSWHCLLLLAISHPHIKVTLQNKLVDNANDSARKCNDMCVCGCEKFREHLCYGIVQICILHLGLADCMKENKNDHFDHDF